MVHSVGVMMKLVSLGLVGQRLAEAAPTNAAATELCFGKGLDFLHQGVCNQYLPEDRSQVTDAQQAEFLRCMCYTAIQICGDSKTHCEFATNPGYQDTCIEAFEPGLEFDDVPVAGQAYCFPGFRAASDNIAFACAGIRCRDTVLNFPDLDTTQITRVPSLQGEPITTGSPHPSDPPSDSTGLVIAISCVCALVVTLAVFWHIRKVTKQVSGGHVSDASIGGLPVDSDSIAVALPHDQDKQAVEDLQLHELQLAEVAHDVKEKAEPSAPVSPLLVPSQLYSSPRPQAPPLSPTDDGGTPPQTNIPTHVQQRQRHDSERTLLEEDEDLFSDEETKLAVH